MANKWKNGVVIAETATEIAEREAWQASHQAEEAAALAAADDPTERELALLDLVNNVRGSGQPAITPADFKAALQARR